MSRLKSQYEVQQERFFNKFYEQFETKDYSVLDLPSQMEIQNFMSFFAMPDGSKLLEVGCGVGRYILPLLKFGYSVTGVDISEYSLNALRMNAEKLNLLERLNLINDNFEQPRFKDCFDGAYAINLLHHVKDRQVQFENIVQAVKPGGTVLVLEPNPYNPLFYPYYALTGTWRLEKGFLDSTRDKLSRLFSGESLDKIEITRYGMLPSSLGRIFPFVLRLNHIMSRLPIVQVFSAFTLIKGIRR